MARTSRNEGAKVTATVGSKSYTLDRDALLGVNRDEQRAAEAEADMQSVELEGERLLEQLEVIIARVNAVFAPRLLKDEEGDPPTMNGEVLREKRTLITQLSAEELAEESTELARNIKKAEVVRDLRKALAGGTADTLKALEARVSAGASVVSRGERSVAVTCVHVLSPDARTVNIMRLDTGVEIETRESKMHERQAPLPLGGA